jgi:charged multivesicular body protein 7
MGIVGDEGMLGSLTGSTGSGGGGGGGGGRGGLQGDTSWWGDYVILSLVEKAADKVVERHEARGKGTKADDLYAFDEFRRAFGGVAGGREDEMLRETDANVLLKYLERDRRTIVVDQEVCCIQVLIYSVYIIAC